MENLSLLWSEEYRHRVIGGTAVGVLFVSVLLHSFSYLLFMLWTGLLGVSIAYSLIRWRLGLDLQQSNACLKGAHAGPGEKEDSSECDTCDGNYCSCIRSGILGVSRQPWVGLIIPQKVDNALENFLVHLLEKFIYNWYRQIISEEATVDELRVGLRFLFASLLVRLKKVELAEFISKDIIPAVVTHLVQHVHSHRKVGRYNADHIRLRRNRVHRSLFNREDELRYLRQLSASLYPYILADDVQHCRSVRVLLEQLLSGVVLLPTMDKIADPDFVNTLLLEFLDNTPPQVNPDPPSQPVELLANFARPNSTSASFHCHDLTMILNDQLLLMVFMDVMKQHGGLKFLQFFLTLEDFKKELLAADLDGSMEQKLQDEASHMYRVFCRPDATDYIDLGQQLLDKFRYSEELNVAESGAHGVREARSDGEFLTRSYDYLYNLMDNYYLPIFTHSQQYFAHLYGGKSAGASSSSRSMKGDRRGFSLSSRLRSSLKGERLGGGSLSGSSNNLKDLDTNSPSSTPDRVSLQDEELADETFTDDLHDLSLWTVDMPSVSIQPDSKGKVSYSFQIKVYKNDLNQTLSVGEETRASSSVYRTYNDFYLLEQRLKHFHGETLIAQLPAKKIFTIKDHEYLDVVKPRFESFLKSVLKMPDLKNSELLYTFLTVHDFTRSGGTDVRIENVLKSVPGKLVKEKGQNLKGFLKAFQSSTVPKAPRPDFSKLVESAAERGDEPASLITRHLRNPLYEKSHVRQPSNGVAVEPNNHLLTVTADFYSRSSLNTDSQPTIIDCVLRIAEEVFTVSKRVHWLLMTVALIGKDWVDKLVTWFIGNKLEQVLEEHRLESLINLLRDSIFHNDGQVRTSEQKVMRKKQALAELKQFMPGLLRKVGGGEVALEEMFEVLQHPKLNKQLAYILLDIVVYELFPELKP